MSPTPCTNRCCASVLHPRLHRGFRVSKYHKITRARLQQMSFSFIVVLPQRFNVLLDDARPATYLVNPRPWCGLVHRRPCRMGAYCVRVGLPRPVFPRSKSAVDSEAPPSHSHVVPQRHLPFIAPPSAFWRHLNVRNVVHCSTTSTNHCKCQTVFVEFERRHNA